MTVRPAPARRLALGGILAIAAALLALTGCSPPAPVTAASPSGASPTIEVQDGDSFTMRIDDGPRLRVRVSGIDAPERRQPWSDAARRHLGELLRGGRVRLEPIKQDTFGRTVARVLVADAVGGTERDVGLEQVRAGLAWHFARYAADQGAAEARRYADAERVARQARIGLWADPAPEAPWAYRSRMRRDEVSRP